MNNTITPTRTSDRLRNQSTPAENSTQKVQTLDQNSNQSGRRVKDPLKSIIASLPGHRFTDRQMDVHRKNLLRFIGDRPEIIYHIGRCGSDSSYWEQCWSTLILSDHLVRTMNGLSEQTLVHLNTVCSPLSDFLDCNLKTLNHGRDIFRKRKTQYNNKFLAWVQATGGNTAAPDTYFIFLRKMRAAKHVTEKVISSLARLRRGIQTTPAEALKVMEYLSPYFGKFPPQIFGRGGKQTTIPILITDEELEQLLRRKLSLEAFGKLKAGGWDLGKQGANAEKSNANKRKRANADGSNKQKRPIPGSTGSRPPDWNPRQNTPRKAAPLCMDQHKAYDELPSDMESESASASASASSESNLPNSDSNSDSGSDSGLESKSDLPNSDSGSDSGLESESNLPNSDSGSDSELETSSKACDELPSDMESASSESYSEADSEAEEPSNSDSGSDSELDSESSSDCEDSDKVDSDKAAFYCLDSNTPVIIVETYRSDEDGSVVRGVASKSAGLAYLKDNTAKRRLSDVLVCPSSSTYIYCFSDANLRPHFVTSEKKASKYIDEVRKLYGFDVHLDILSRISCRSKGVNIIDKDGSTNFAFFSSDTQEFQDTFHGYRPNAVFWMNMFDEKKYKRAETEETADEQRGFTDVLDIGFGRNGVNYDHRVSQDTGPTVICGKPHLINKEFKEEYAQLGELMDCMQLFANKNFRDNQKKLFDDSKRNEIFAEVLKEMTGSKHCNGEAVTIVRQRLGSLADVMAGLIQFSDTLRHLDGPNCNKKGYRHTIIYSTLVVWNGFVYRLTFIVYSRESCSTWMSKNKRALAFRTKMKDYQIGRNGSLSYADFTLCNRMPYSVHVQENLPGGMNGYEIAPPKALLTKNYLKRNPMCSWRLVDYNKLGSMKWEDIESYPGIKVRSRSNTMQREYHAEV